MPGIHNRPCGIRECKSSIHISGQFMTFGQGHLDREGYQEIPCRKCAEAFTANRKKALKEIRKRLADRGVSKAEIETFLSETPWLRNEAWPFASPVEEDSGMSDQALVTTSV